MKTALFVGDVDIERNYVQYKIIDHRIIEPENGAFPLRNINAKNINILNAKDVTEALRMLKAKNVDIVFLGEETPQKLVKKFYEKVRAMPQHRELPIYTVPIMLKYNYKRADDDGPDYDTGYFVCR